MSGVQRRGPLGRVPRLRRVQHDQAERVSDLPALPVELLRVPAGHQDGDGDALWVEELLHGDPAIGRQRSCWKHLSGRYLVQYRAVLSERV